MKNLVQLALIAIAMSTAASCSKSGMECECWYDDYNKSEKVQMEASCTNHTHEHPDVYDICEQVL